MVSHCFYFYFPDSTQHGASFHMLICHLYIYSGIFGEISVKAFGPFINCVVFLLLSFNILSYILDSSPLSDMSFANTYS